MDTTPILPPNLKAEWSPVACKKKDFAQACARLFRQKYPAAAAKCNGRIERAVEIVQRPGACLRAEGFPEYVFFVKSEHNARGVYLVDLKARTCTCPDAGNGQLCKHRLAVGFHFYGHEWIHEEAMAKMAETNRLRDLAKARQTMLEAWKQASCAISAWEDAAQILKPDGSYPDDQDLADLRARMLEALEHAHAAQDKFNRLANPA